MRCWQGLYQYCQCVGHTFKDLYLLRQLCIAKTWQIQHKPFIGETVDSVVYRVGFLWDKWVPYKRFVLYIDIGIVVTCERLSAWRQKENNASQVDKSVY